MPFLSEKIVSTEKISLTDSDDIFSSDHETVRVLNTFFSNVVSSPKTPEYTNYDSISNDINDPIIKSIVKYRNHPSILPKGEVRNRIKKSSFSFSDIDKKRNLTREI